MVYPRDSEVYDMDNEKTKIELIEDADATGDVPQSMTSGVRNPAGRRCRGF